MLRQKLRKELEARQASISHHKADLVEGNKAASRAMELKLKKEGELKKRLAAFAIFNRNASLARKLAGNSQAKKQKKIPRAGYGCDPFGVEKYGRFGSCANAPTSVLWARFRSGVL